MKKIISVVGARPEFIQVWATIPYLEKFSNHTILHSGQHYDFEMSQVFFDDFSIAKPKYNLGVGSASHGAVTSKILSGCEEIFLAEKPDLVIVRGDTNTTLASALAAAKLNIPVAHIEAGMRSFDRSMPEEINRVVVDHISSLFLCSSKVAVFNLRHEGIDKNVFLTGDVMLDVLNTVSVDFSIIEKLNLGEDEYFFATIHRQENVDSANRLKEIIHSLENLELPVILPIHPRTRKALSKFKIRVKKVKIINPVSYLQNIALISCAKAVITDSGGIQKEAYWKKVPCFTLRNTTEWVETVDSGWNILVGDKLSKMGTITSKFKKPKTHPDFFGRGNAAFKITQHVKEFVK